MTTNEVILLCALTAYHSGGWEGRSLYTATVSSLSKPDPTDNCHNSLLKLLREALNLKSSHPSSAIPYRQGLENHLLGTSFLVYVVLSEHLS